MVVEESFQIFINHADILGVGWTHIRAEPFRDSSELVVTRGIVHSSGTSLSLCTSNSCLFPTPSCSILKHCKDVELSFSDVSDRSDMFRGTKKGMLYLTPYRVSLESVGFPLFPPVIP